MNNFEYLEASTLEELPKLFAEHGEDTVLLAGGTDLLDRLKERLVEPGRVINIKKISELYGIKEDQELEIGALTTIADVAGHPTIRRSYRVLAQAAESVATPQLRNMGTIGGNLTQRPRCWYFRGKEYHCLKKGGDDCFAVDGQNKYHAIFGGGPCYIVHPSDCAPALAALNARVEILSRHGTRVVPVDDFFVLPEQKVSDENVLQAGEILTRILIPPPESGSRSLYLKFREKESHDFAICSVAVNLRMNGRRVEQAGIVLGGVAPVPWRAKAAQAALENKTLSEETIANAAQAAIADAEPLDHNEYKVQLIHNLVRRTLRRIVSG